MKRGGFILIIVMFFLIFSYSKPMISGQVVAASCENDGDCLNQYCTIDAYGDIIHYRGGKCENNICTYNQVTCPFGCIDETGCCGLAEGDCCTTEPQCAEGLTCNPSTNTCVSLNPEEPEIIDSEEQGDRDLEGIVCGDGICEPNEEISYSAYCCEDDCDGVLCEKEETKIVCSMNRHSVGSESKSGAQICKDTFGESANCVGIEPPAIVSGCTIQPSQIDCFTEFSNVAVEVSCCYDYIPIFDWHNLDKEDWMSPVQDQGFTCGSCWAFATIGTVEAQNNINNNNPDLDINLSEQELISCSSAGDCDGGSFRNALDYIFQTGSLIEECFPYLAMNSDCIPQCNIRHNINSFESFDANDFELLKARIRMVGPVALAIEWNANMFDEEWVGRCEPGVDEIGNHGVVLTGYNDYEEYWIFKNSWTTWWGEDGYAKLAYDSGCNLIYAWGVE